ncbi:unnamed protein product [Rangifer tarandus platyrhynchus]|uniref:Uncharacterized protein n=1 Tax=Rangifer tarandus platyrhynchus TaxID=3082113 RepID=A0AC59YUQ4_RANTA
MPTTPNSQAFGTSVCIEKTAQEPVPATKRGLLRLSPMTHTTTSTTVGDPEPAETLMLSSLSPQDFCGVADLTSIVQLWKLRLTKGARPEPPSPVGSPVTPVLDHTAQPRRGALISGGVSDADSGMWRALEAAVA